MENVSNDINSQAYYSENHVLCFSGEQWISTLPEENAQWWEFNVEIISLGSLNFCTTYRLGQSMKIQHRLI
jgi:hypothetical protein